MSSMDLKYKTCSLAIVGMLLLLCADESLAKGGGRGGGRGGSGRGSGGRRGGGGVSGGAAGYGGDSGDATGIGFGIAFGIILVIVMISVCVCCCPGDRCSCSNGCCRERDVERAGVHTDSCSVTELHQRTLSSSLSSSSAAAAGAGKQFDQIRLAATDSQFNNLALDAITSHYEQPSASSNPGDEQPMSAPPSYDEIANYRALPPNYSADYVQATGIRCTTV